MPNYAGYGTYNYAAGDNYGYGRHYAAGGIFSGIGKLAGKVLGGAARAVGIGLGIVPPPQLQLPGGLPPIMRSVAPPQVPVPRDFPGAQPKPGFEGGVERFLPGGESGYILAPGVMCDIKGTHRNKSGYYRQTVKGDPTSAVYVPPGSMCVKNRRMNVGNAKALRKSVRRAQGFAKMARRVMTFVDARAPKGRARFKRKR